ncbi:hypothetical protein OGAPHI_001274 [Ogataea philodendri]|uniref:Uncharacterized protein n=1 Tax=Ogataea philodendri TaxID=1378263 RepID=A0A9P8T8X5_9ASCO|nr:uncharacterized protein OGAPHI_001274 [Ogataea philodendri]KAH3670758.1 hypothetical protein OGAPHI_001274 [Ogataea philodendri]
MRLKHSSVSAAVDFLVGDQVGELVELGLGQLDVGVVLVVSLCGGSRRNWNHRWVLFRVLAEASDPRQGDLGKSCILGLGKLGNVVDDALVGVDSFLGSKPVERATVICLVQVVDRLDRAGQITSSERRVRNHRDSQLFAGVHDSIEQNVCTPQRKLHLDTGNWINCSSTSDGVCIDLRKRNSLDGSSFNERNHRLDKVLHRDTMIHAAGLKQIELVFREVRGNVLNGSLDTFRRTVWTLCTKTALDRNSHLGSVFWVLFKISFNELKVLVRLLFNRWIRIEHVDSIKLTAVQESNTVGNCVVDGSKSLLIRNWLGTNSKRHKSIARWARDRNWRWRTH